MSYPPPPSDDQQPTPGVPDPYGSPAPDPYGSPAPDPYGTPAPPAYGAPAYGANQPPAYGAPTPYGDAAASPYGAPNPYPSANPTAKNSLGIWGLVLGIVGLCCGPAAIGGLILSKQGKDAAARGEATNGGLAQAGFVISIIMLALWVISFAYQASAGFPAFDV